MDAAYPWVAVIGFVVGCGELISRYKDEPARALVSWPATLYVAINVLAALLALRFVDTFGWIAEADADKKFLLRVTTAGAGALALFRSAVFTARIGGKDVGIGLSALLDLFLEATDRAVDRSRAKPRAELIVHLMSGIDFDKAAPALPPFCMALMQNVSLADQKTLGDSVSLLAQSTSPNDVKCAILGLTLLTLVGEDVLTTAVKELRPKLEVAAAAAAAATPVPVPVP